MAAPPIQVAIMCSPGRPALQRACVARLRGPGQIFEAPLACAPRIYFATSTPDLLRLVDPVWVGFDVRPEKAGRPHLPSFWRVFEEAEGGVPLLFLENDVWIVEGGVPRIAALAAELPGDAGLVSLFDFRNESNGQRWQVLDPSRVFWGTQAVLFSAAAVEALGHFAREKRAFDSFDSWDVWSGLAVTQAKLGHYLHAPSLVQHLGTRSEVWPDRPWMPQAKNFPEIVPELLGLDDLT